MRTFLLLVVIALAGCQMNPNAEPALPENDGPAFYLHGFPVYATMYYGNHCFLIDFHASKTAGVSFFGNTERYMFACSGH